MSTPDIDEALHALRRTRQRLMMYGQVIFLITSMHLVIVVSALTNLLRPIALATVYSLATLVLAAGAALLFESSRKRGESLFEEISDEFQWHVGIAYMKSPGPENPVVPPPLGVRVELRSFARSSDLPLAPGRYGPLAYVAINVVLLLIVVIRVLM